jgi:hypothetical protein
VPIVAFALLLVALVLVGIAILPLSLIQRYRVGTRRRQARAWFIAVNVVAAAISSALFLIASAMTTAWVPGAFTYTAIGFAVGAALGVVGLALTRWEPDRRVLHFTPNRSLVLVITLLVAARLAYGFWRSWDAWKVGLHSWTAAFGVASSMGAGAIVLGNYLTYWLGVRRRFIRHRHGG